MAKKYIVRLDNPERGQLEQLVKVGKQRRINASTHKSC